MPAALVGLKFSQLPVASGTPPATAQFVTLEPGNVVRLVNFSDMENAISTAVMLLPRSINLQTTDYTLRLSDAGNIVEMNATVPNTVTIPAVATEGWQVCTEIDVLQRGPGITMFQPAAGVQLLSASTSLQLLGQYYGCTLLMDAPDVWLLQGALSP